MFATEAILHFDSNTIQHTDGFIATAATITTTMLLSYNIHYTYIHKTLKFQKKTVK
jgi:hypothetical protein